MNTLQELAAAAEAKRIRHEPGFFQPPKPYHWHNPFIPGVIWIMIMKEYIKIRQQEEKKIRSGCFI
jgi:hypothetical protein